MLETREKVLSRINELQKVEFPKPTALHLHSPRPLMARVERQQQKLYKQKIEEQIKNFKLKQEKIKKYYADLKAEEQRRLDLLASLEGYASPVFQPINLVVPKPVISIPGMPVKRSTRLHPRRRIRRLRRLR